MPRRNTSPAYREAQKKARRDRLDQRARLIGAGIVVTPSKRRNKYNRVVTTFQGERYDSLGEAEYAHKLTLRLKAGEILSWNRPSPIVLVDGPYRDRITYQPDFEIKPLSGPAIYIDYKGSKVTETAVWKLKVKLWRLYIPFELRVAYPTGEERVVCTGNA